MCGIAGIISLNRIARPDLKHRLEVMNELQVHRGPDGSGLWTHPDNYVGVAHRRLSIIDLKTGTQPMTDRQGNWITYNGEIYNYIELRNELGLELFTTN